MRIALQVLNLVGRRHRGEYLRHQRTRLGTVIVRIVASAQRIEAAVEGALEAIDDKRIKAAETFFIEHVVKPVLAFDQEMQAALAIPDIEGEQVSHPARQTRRRGRVKLERFAIDAFV